jgi:DNA-binding response OmpR family regulator
MCGLGGEDLAREVMKHSPRLRVLYMSGDRPDDLRLAADLHHDFIGKPFSPAELSRRVEALLAQ